MTDPFWMLVACQLVNLTTWRQAKPVLWWLRHEYADEWGLAKARSADLRRMLRPLGLWRRRARTLVAMARAWTTSPPLTAEDVMRLPGCGRYAADSWAIFVEGRRDVSPSDRRLRWYLERR